MKAAFAAPREVESNFPHSSVPSFWEEKKKVTWQCARHNAVVVSYVAMQGSAALDNAAIDGSVYECIVGNYHYARAPCCEDASQTCWLKRRVKKRKIVISKFGVIVIYVREIHMATSLTCGTLRVLLRSNDRKRCSWIRALRAALLRRDSFVDWLGSERCADV